MYHFDYHITSICSTLTTLLLTTAITTINILPPMHSMSNYSFFLDFATGAEEEEPSITGGLFRQNHTALLHLNPDPNATCRIRCPVIIRRMVVCVDRRDEHI